MLVAVVVVVEDGTTSSLQGFTPTRFTAMKKMFLFMVLQVVSDEFSKRFIITIVLYV